MKCNLAHEKQLRARGCAWIAGIDEAGRGPLAGPVVAAAVILPEKFRHKRLTDSKQLCENRREEIYAELTTRTEIFWAVAIAEHDEVDRLNILRASHAAMRRAVEALVQRPDHVLIDGLRVDGFQSSKPRSSMVTRSVSASGRERHREGHARSFDARTDIHFRIRLCAAQRLRHAVHLDGFASRTLHDPSPHFSAGSAGALPVRLRTSRTRSDAGVNSSRRNICVPTVTRCSIGIFGRAAEVKSIWSAAIRRPTTSYLSK